ncbi:MAG: hypothetical protein LUC36_00840 [Oscillospiraceae bacterium]|nr:hypothetical protein [Oscillospiraceae bacterium]
MKEKRISGEYGEIVVYQTEDGLTQLDVKLEDETVCVTESLARGLSLKSVR